MGLLSTKIIGNAAQRKSTSDIRLQSLAPYLLPTPFPHFCELNYPIGIHKASATAENRLGLLIEQVIVDALFSDWPMTAIGKT